MKARVEGGTGIAAAPADVRVVATATPQLVGKERVRGLEAERQSLVALLDLIRTIPPATRLDLERLSGMSRAVVADRLATLAQSHLIDETGFGRSVGGRAPRLVRFRAEAGRILVANIDRYTLGVGLADLAGQLVFEHYEDTDLVAGPASVLKRLDALFAWALDQERGGDLWGIALGVPDAVEMRPGEPRRSLQSLDVLPAWGGSQLLTQIVGRLKAPAWVRSSVQMATMGEARAPDRDRKSELLYVELGSEISAGFVSGGRLTRGALGVAGQVGHVFTGPDNHLVCRCGNTGCLETIAGGGAIVQEGLLAAQDGRSRLLAETLSQAGGITVADIGAASQLGDAFSAELLARCGLLIGTMLATVTNAMNPSAIVIGGEVAQTGDILLASIRKGIYRHSHPLATRDLRVVRSSMGRSAGLAGAALVAVEEIFDPRFLDGWVMAGSPLCHPDVVALLEDVGATLARVKPVAPAPPPKLTGVGRRARQTSP